jgi:hypothetical protein
MKMRLFKRRDDEEEGGGGSKRRGGDGEVEEVEEKTDELYEADELAVRAGIIESLAKDADVSTNVKAYKPLIPLDSHKVDFSRVPRDRLDALIVEADLQLFIQELLSNDEDIRFLESYNFLMKLRLYTATEGWLLRAVMGRR